MWAEELQRSELSRDVQKAEQLLRLHNESVQHMQNTTFQVLQRGQELAQVGGDLVFFSCASGRLITPRPDTIYVPNKPSPL